MTRLTRFGERRSCGVGQRVKRVEMKYKWVVRAVNPFLWFTQMKHLSIWVPLSQCPGSGEVHSSFGQPSDFVCPCSFPDSLWFTMTLVNSKYPGNSYIFLTFLSLCPFLAPLLGFCHSVSCFNAGSLQRNSPTRPTATQSGVLIAWRVLRCTYAPLVMENSSKSGTT